MKSGLFKKWWLLQHICDPNGTWEPAKLWTFFGQPVAFMFFRVWGPFRTYESAAREANKANGFGDEYPEGRQCYANAVPRCSARTAEQNKGLPIGNGYALTAKHL